MKNNLFSLAAGALLASHSFAVLASNVTIPNTFTAGTPAVAGEVNANFNAVAAAVNDNNARITTNTADITANATDIATNAADIANLQAAGGCGSDMVAVGPLCVDIYEATVWDAATGGTQITGALPCAADGHGCGANAANPIYARSVADVTPRVQISWYQAAQACANVGKRLPTLGEWVMAASGTPMGPGAGTDPTQECNFNSVSSAVTTTGASAAGATPCVSSWGAFDMAGNLWEWTADLTGMPTAAGFSFTTTDAVAGIILGGSYNSSTSQTTTDLATAGAGPDLASNNEIGFRCVR